VKRRGVDPKVVYTVPELVRLTGISRFKLTGMLRRRQVETVRFGARCTELVPLTAFRDAFPAIWESIVVRCGLVPTDCEAVCPACGTKVAVRGIVRPAA
jgi:hypothetical protein